MVSTGFTLPSTIRSKMDDVDVSAGNLDSSVEANITLENPFRAAWHGWLVNWNAFYDKYSDWSPSIYVNSDEVNAQVDAYSNELRGWYDSYSKQRGLDGKIVPNPSGQPPGGPAGIPSWVWALGVLTAGYVGYRYVTRTSVRGRKS